jgi:hypothetical protein
MVKGIQRRHTLLHLSEYSNPSPTTSVTFQKSNMIGESKALWLTGCWGSMANVNILQSLNKLPIPSLNIIFLSLKIILKSATKRHTAMVILKLQN